MRARAAVVAAIMLFTLAYDASACVSIRYDATGATPHVVAREMAAELQLLS